MIWHLHKWTKWEISKHNWEDFHDIWFERRCIMCDKGQTSSKKK